MGDISAIGKPKVQGPSLAPVLKYYKNMQPGTAHLSVPTCCPLVVSLDTTVVYEVPSLGLEVYPQTSSWKLLWYNIITMGYYLKLK